jgi:hypothetical protein
MGVYVITMMKLKESQLLGLREYIFLQSTVTCTDSVKDLGLFLDSKQYFHTNANYIFSRCFMLLDMFGA